MWWWFSSSSRRLVRTNERNTPHLSFSSRRLDPPPTDRATSAQRSAAQRREEENCRSVALALGSQRIRLQSLPLLCGCSTTTTATTDDNFLFTFKVDSVFAIGSAATTTTAYIQHSHIRAIAQQSISQFICVRVCVCFNNSQKHCNYQLQVTKKKIKN